jgi:hypothetical protein
LEKLENRIPQSGFLYGMEAAAQNPSLTVAPKKPKE